MNVLFEDRREPGTGYLQGVTDNYIRVFAPGPDSAKNSIAPVRLTDVRNGRVIGKMADGSPERRRQNPDVRRGDEGGGVTMCSR